jgi:pilus assembly protein CpaC
MNKFGSIIHNLLLISGLAAFAALPIAANVAQAQTLVANSGRPIALSVGKGVLISLDHDADTVFVADTNIADVLVKSPKLIFIFGKAPGNTSIYAVDAEQHVMLSRPITVKHDLDTLQNTLSTLYPRGNIRLTEINQSLVLTGNVASPGDAADIKRLADTAVSSDAQLINRLEVDAPTQVNLRVRIAEVNHSVIKELGLNWDVVLHPGSFVFGVATGNSVLGTTGGSAIVPSLAAAGSTAGMGLLTRNAGAAGATTDSIMAGVNAGGNLVDSVIDALDQNGLVNTLAEPNLTATSGETASFLAGGEFPILIPSSTLGQATVEFKQSGVSLAFTPVILADGRISLRVRPEVSQLSNQGAVSYSGTSIPALTTRRAETTVELGSGESFAIGGLLENSNTNNINTLPGLGNLPVLGGLFRSTQFQHNETELVILVTPYLVRPVTNGQLQTPIDGYVPPTNRQLFIDGHDAQRSKSAGPASTAGGQLVGPAGFVLN